MDKGIDVGFFEPFRNNIVKIEGNKFTINITNPILFDSDMVNKYFDEAVVHYIRDDDRDPYSKINVTLECVPKNQEVIGILTGMFYNRQIIF